MSLSGQAKRRRGNILLGSLWVLTTLGGSAYAVWLLRPTRLAPGQSTEGAWTATIIIGLLVGAAIGTAITIAIALAVVGVDSFRRFVRWRTGGYWLVETQVRISHRGEEGRSSPHRMVVRATSSKEAQATAPRSVPTNVEREALPSNLGSDRILYLLAQRPDVRFRYETTILGWSRRRRGPFLQVTEAPEGASSPE